MMALYVLAALVAVLYVRREWRNRRLPLFPFNR